MSKKITLNIVGSQTMHCNGCERTVEFTLSHLPGIKAVNADNKTQIIEVSLASDETDIEKIKEELNWIGYEVEPA